MVQGSEEGRLTKRIRRHPMSLRARWCALVAVACVYSAVCLGRQFDAPGRPFSLATTQIAGVEYVRVSDLAKALGFRVTWETDARRLELKGSSISVTMMPGMRCAVFDKKATAFMSAPLRCVKGVAYIPSDFITSTLKPYYGRWPAWIKNNGVVVVLDPGHGGNDQGATGRGGMLEKTLNLDLARRVGRILTSNGYTVVMTRTTDTYMGLSARAAVANARSAAALVSIHANSVSSGAGSISGTETFYRKTAYVKAVPQPTPQKQGLFSRWFTRKKTVDIRAKSRELAQNVQTRTTRATVGENRGIKSRNMVVLREAECPACLVEVGFISNPVDAERLRNDAYKESLARAIALGIIDSLHTR